MLELLDTIDWSQTSSCYGSAEKIPSAIRGLISDKTKTRHEALSTLHMELEHQGSVYQASAYAVPFLLELVAAPQTPEKGELVELLAYLGSGGAHLGKHFESLERRLARQRIALRERKESLALQELTRDDRRWSERTHQAVREGLPLLLPLLTDIDAAMRMKVTFLLTFFPEDRSWLLPPIITQLTGEADEHVLCCLLLYLGHLLSPTPDASRLLMQYLLEGETKFLRFSAALALCALLKEEAPKEVIHFLLHALVSPYFMQIPDNLFPREWSGSWSPMRALFYLDQLTSSPHQTLIMERLIEIFPLLHENIELECTDLLLRIAFYEKGFQLYTPFEDLDLIQQAILQTLVAKETLWTKPSFDPFLDETTIPVPAPVSSLAYLGLPSTRQSLQAFIARSIRQ